MERIIGKRESERVEIERIKKEYNIAVLHEDSDDSTIFVMQNGEGRNCNVQVSGTQPVLRLSPRTAALRRNPSAAGGRRVPCMADIERIETSLVSGTAAQEGKRELMSGALAYQNRMQVPLCLVETDGAEVGADFFSRGGFQYICGKSRYKLNPERLSVEMLERAARGEIVSLGEPDVTLQAANPDDMLPLAHFVNARLCRRYGFFLIRSAAYYERLQKKLQSRGGNLFQIMKDGVRSGCFAYAGGCISEAVFDKVSEQARYLLAEDSPKPTVMARIVNMPAMLRHISGSGNITIAIRIKDPEIAENDGLFIWYIDAGGSHMERVELPKDGSRPEVTATIGEFTAFIFDYIKLKENAKFDSIYLAGPAWINEKYEE